MSFLFTYRKPEPNLTIPPQSANKTSIPEDHRHNYDKNKASYSKRIYLFKGYIFLEYDEKYKVAYEKLKHTPFFSGILSSNKKMQLIPEQEIQKMQDQLNNMITPLGC